LNIKEVEISGAAEWVPIWGPLCSYFCIDICWPCLGSKARILCLDSL
jgi:hypothetical protein